MTDFTPREMMTVAAAREIRNGDIVFCGTGISMLAAMAAKRISAPGSIIVFETGAVDSRLDELPLSVSDPRIMQGAALNAGLAEAFALLQNPKTGPRVVGILGAAQIDRFGNLNSTMLGDYARPVKRFPGSGGACDVASLAGRTIVFMQQEKKRFVPKLDYRTSPGWLSGPGGRAAAGLRSGGPSAVVTTMAVMRFHEKTKEMVLDGLYPGVTARMVQEAMGFVIDGSGAGEVEPPSELELRVLREECDPHGLILR